MQYDVSTPEAYFEALASDWRKDQLLAVRQILLTTAPDLIEGIQYKMLAYQLDGQYLFNLNAQKNYVALYIGTIDKVEEGRALLEPFDLGKGCIRIRKSVDIAATELGTFIERAISLAREGKDLGC